MENLFIAPGNAGTAGVGQNVAIKADDFESLKQFVADNGVDMVVVGPEDPLVKGIYDDFKADERTAGVPVIGPSKAGAVLEGSKDFEADLQALIRSVLIKHKRILFKGNGYDAAWIAEAERRGLLNLRTTPEALPYYLADKNVALFTKHHVYTRTEMEARYEIHLENYSKILNIEALTMLEMARRDIMPAVSSYLRELSETAAAIHAASVTADCSYEESIIPEMSALLGDAYRKVRSLDEALMGAKTVEGSQALANYYRDKVFSAMAELRITIDQLETMTPSDKWPVPSYGDLLFSVR